MGYITPKTDWISSDFFNVADWTRIINNSRLASALAEIVMGVPVAYTPVAEPTTTTNPQDALSRLNTVLANIEATRVAVSASLPTLAEIKHDWLAGRDKVSPNYTHANQWESTIDAIWNFLGGNFFPVCPILSSNLTIPTATEYTVVDCIDPGNFEIIIEGTGELHVI